MTVTLAGAIAMLVYLKIYSVECATLTETDVKEMLMSTLRAKHERVGSGAVIFGFEYTRMSIKEVGFYEGPRSFDNSFDATFIDKETGEFLFSASIYPNCEIQLVKGSTQ